MRLQDFAKGVYPPTTQGFFRRNQIKCWKCKSWGHVLSVCPLLYSNQGGSLRFDSASSSFSSVIDVSLWPNGAGVGWFRRALKRLLGLVPVGHHTSPLSKNSAFTSLALRHKCNPTLQLLLCLPQNRSTYLTQLLSLQPHLSSTTTLQRWRSSTWIPPPSCCKASRASPSKDAPLSSVR